jgi:hypothetical protein
LLIVSPLLEKGVELMIFLIEYNRPQGRIVTLRTFKDRERVKAEDLRLELELNLNRRGVEHEVVLLEAVTEQALRRTHRRYFEDLSQLAKSAKPADQ